MHSNQHLHSRLEETMEGLWTIEFGSNAGLFGSGVAVLRDGKIEGGDDSYFYQGSYEGPIRDLAYPSAFHAKIEVKPFLPNKQSIFNTFNKAIVLNLEGTLKDENHAVAVGTPEGMPGMNLGIRLIRRSGNA
jgi:hypothetical protein